MLREQRALSLFRSVQQSDARIEHQAQPSIFCGVVVLSGYPF
jgi:hypothetical protein